MAVFPSLFEPRPAGLSEAHDAALRAAETLWQHLPPEDAFYATLALMQELVDRGAIAKVIVLGTAGERLVIDPRGVEHSLPKAG